MVLRALSPRRLLTVGVILLIAIFLVLLFKKSDKFLEVPDEAHALAGIVSIPGAKPQRGGGDIYYVDVLVQRASLLQAALPFTRPEGSDLIPAEAFVPSPTRTSCSQPVQTRSSSTRLHSSGPR